MKALFSSERKTKEKEREIFWILIIIIIKPLTLASTDILTLVDFTLALEEVSW